MNLATLRHLYRLLPVRQQLNWEPTVSLEQGLGPIIDSFRNLLSLQGDAAA